MKKQTLIHTNDNIQITRYSSEDTEIINYGIYDSKLDPVRGGQKELAYLTVHEGNAMTSDCFQAIINDIQGVFSSG